MQEHMGHSLHSVEVEHLWIRLEMFIIHLSFSQTRTAQFGVAAVTSWSHILL